ncbi:MAG: DUF58 domain-containing protein [Nitrospinales bacterium]
MESQNRAKPLFTFSLKNRTLELTREGGGFVALIFGVGLGAINTGNNLLYLILAMCCSFIAVSGLLSEITLKRIAIEGAIPKTLYAREPYPMTIRVTNHKKKTPSYSLLIKLPPIPDNPLQLEHPFYFFHIPHASKREKKTMFTAGKRGLLEIKTCRVFTSFPFGFFIKSKPVALDLQATVFPAIRNVDLPSPAGVPLQGEGIIKQRGEELYALREFRPGDPISSIHWKSTAKTGSPRVKEFIAGGCSGFTVFLHTQDPQTNRKIEPEVLEKRVTEAASLVYHLIRRGNEVSLKTTDYQSSFGNSPAHLEQLMTYLAFVGLESGQKT